MTNGRIHLFKVLLGISVLVGLLVEPLRQPLLINAQGPLAQIYLPFVSNVTFVVITNRLLWESTVADAVRTEDFENDLADYGTLHFPYLTGNTFWLDGHSSAQILMCGNLLPSGTCLHFRDWSDGLTVWFPDYAPARAFGFDYRAGEEWRMTFNKSETIWLSPSRPGFIGIVFAQGETSRFTLWSHSSVQRGLTVDNISFSPAGMSNSDLP